MKTLCSFILSLWFAFAACAQSKPASNEVIFKNVSVIPMDKEAVIANQDVVVKNGLIADIGAAGKVKHSKNAISVDGKGKYLMPGLVEMHAHVPPVDDLEPMKDVLTLFAANGITTIRGMLGHPRHLELRKMLQSGEITGPRFYTSGPSFNGGSVKTPQEAVDMVKSQKQAGYDFMKIHPGLTRENFDAMAKTAREVKIPFAGHVPYDVGVWRAIEAKYASIDHLDGFVESLVPRLDTIGEQKMGLFAMYASRYADTTRIPKLIDALKQRKIWVAPTQALAERWFAPDKTAESLSQLPEMKYMDPKVIADWIKSKKNLMVQQQYDPEAMTAYVNLRRKLIYECSQNGVGLILASDAPQIFNVPGFSTHQELDYMVASGLSPYEALKTGTVNVGRYFNLKNLGMVKKGATADLLLLNGNPLEDIAETKNIAGVLLNGRWLPRTKLDEMLKSAEKK